MATESYARENFSQILSWYSALLKNKMLGADEANGLTTASPFWPDYWEVVTYHLYTKITRKVYNPGWKYGNSLLDAMETTSNNILIALSTLFTNYDDDEAMRQENLNFHLINAYAAASQSYKWYDKTTEEFVERPEFWFTRGCWYDMLPMCTKGKYLLVYQKAVNKVCEYIMTCRKKFLKHTYTYYVTDTDSDGGSSTTTVHTEHYSPIKGGNSRSFIETFWRTTEQNTDMLSWLETKSDPLLKPIFDMGIETKLPEQTSKTADLVYITQLVSDISESTSSIGTSKITSAKSLSDSCGTYDANAAGVTLSC